MSLIELPPTVRSLSRQDKLRLIELLAADLARDEDPSPIVAGRSYPLWSPDRAYEAAATMLQGLNSETENAEVGDDEQTQHAIRAAGLRNAAGRMNGQS